MAKYKVRLDCEVAGRWRTTADEFELADAAAKHLRPPYGNVLAPAGEPEKAPAPVALKTASKATDENG